MMEISMRFVLVLSLALALLSNARAQSPDLVISDIPDILHYGPVGRVHAYSVGFTVCNAGDANAAWVSFNNQHPVEGWNLFRISNGRIEQLGLSWLKHGFFAASEPGCGDCDIRQNGNRLGPGCQDVYDAELNAYQPGLGPRSQVNPSTASFPFPPSSPGGPSGNAIYKLCRALDADLITPNATYIVEGQILHFQEPPGPATFNNNSFRQISIDPSTLDATLQGETVPQTPAIYAWKSHANGTNNSDSSILFSTIDIPNDGRLIIASRATQVSLYQWHYEYAIQNLTSDRAAASLFIPTWHASTPWDFGFHDVPYHSGEPYNSFPWFQARDAEGWGWRISEPFAANPNANALRWGTLYSFWFDSCVAPGEASAQIDLFKPPAPGTSGPSRVSAIVLAPVAGDPFCPADLDDGLSQGCPDGGVTIDDLLFYLILFAEGHPSADLDDGSASGTLDGGVTIDDLLYYLDHFAAGC